MPITEQDLAAILQKITLKNNTNSPRCCGLFSKRRKQPFSIKKNGWENFSKNQKLPQALVIDIETVNTLQLLMKEIYRLNQEKNPEQRIILRVAAGGKKNSQGRQIEYSESFSFTACIEADLIVRLVGPEFQTIQIADADTKLIRIGAGVQIGPLNQILYKGLPTARAAKRLSLSLPTSSLIPYVTVIGLADNGGHGTGLNQPSVSGLIQALTFCRPDGEIVRIDADHQDFETIRACFFSLFGIVIEVELQCMEAVKLECITETRTITNFKKELENGLIQKNSYLSVMYIPTYDEKTDNPSKNVVIEKMEPVSLDVETQNNQTSLNQLGQAVSIKLNEYLNLGSQLSKSPHLIPFYMKSIVSKIEVGKKDSLSIAPLPDLAHYQTAFPRNIDDSSYLFPFKLDDHRVIDALDAIVNLLNYYAEHNYQYPIIDAIYFRFFKGTNGGLSPSFHQANEYICAVDLVSDPTIPGYADFKKDIEAFFISKLQARPHWGKYVPLDFDYPTLYGKGYKNFMEALTRWYQACELSLEKSPFLNPFFCNLLNLPFAPQMALQEQKEEKNELQKTALNITKIQPNLSEIRPSTRTLLFSPSAQEEANSSNKRAHDNSTPASLSY